MYSKNKCSSLSIFDLRVLFRENPSEEWWITKKRWPSNPGALFNHVAATGIYLHVFSFSRADCFIIVCLSPYWLDCILFWSFFPPCRYATQQEASCLRANTSINWTILRILPLYTSANVPFPTSHCHKQKFTRCFRGTEGQHFIACSPLRLSLKTPPKGLHARRKISWWDMSCSILPMADS